MTPSVATRSGAEITAQEEQKMKTLLIAATMILGGCTANLASNECLAELEGDGTYTPEDSEELDVRCPAETGFTDRRGNGNNPALNASGARRGNGNNPD